MWSYPVFSRLVIWSCIWANKLLQLVGIDPIQNDYELNVAAFKSSILVSNLLYCAQLQLQLCLLPKPFQHLQLSGAAGGVLCKSDDLSS